SKTWRSGRGILRPARRTTPAGNGTKSVLRPPRSESMFLSHFSYRVSAILLSLATLACQRPAPPIAANPDCSAVMAQQEQQRTDPSVRPSTYDSHSQSDTAAHAVTAVKGCILIKWIHAFDSA